MAGWLRWLTNALGVTHAMSLATLIILGRDLKPDLVSGLLGIEPDQAWARGERKSYKRKDGSARTFDSRHGRGGWKAFLKGPTRRRSLPAQIRFWFDRLMAKRSAVFRLQRLGYSVLIDCCATAPDSFHLDAELHKQLGALKVGLDVAFYRSQESPNG